MHKFLIPALLISFSVLFHTPPKQRQTHLLNETGNIIVTKNYYLLSCFQHDKDAYRIISKDTGLTRLLKDKLHSISTALEECKNSPACMVAAIEFSETDMATVSARLSELYTDGNALGKVAKNLLNAHCYIRFENGSRKDLLLKAWEQDAKGINFAIDVYAGGKKPNYPNIDSISFNVNDSRYNSLLYNAVYTLRTENSDTASFFSLPLNAALLFLDINARNNAADYEPMNKGENKAAFDRIETIDWTKYAYSVIVVPGAGPEEPTVALSAEGMLRCRLAAAEYKKNQAPFLLLSGGKVHPYKTKYCEATEMKKYMIETLHVPASAILIDPHARHTTTNMRNAVRIMYRYGIPLSKPALTCTTRGQSNMIETTLPARCEKELEEVPYKNGKRLSETLIEFYPTMDAMHINPWEPMDP